MAGQTTDHERCLRPGCGRQLISEASRARGYGWGCWRRIRAAAKAEAVAAKLAGFTARQLDDARELVEDAAVIPTALATVFRTISHDGLRVYLTTARGFTCRASGPCFHRAGVILVTA
ncbi:DUF6011 domain-containing protein [Trebonia sp.]|uniref:DUF6011 domain-containing protein n=1 Tax=Trebonia sp. TaxID=2767075 RepID=UPI00261C87F7|nr:DUF6011 domain-containing protein [Trebonia sp.]